MGFRYATGRLFKPKVGISSPLEIMGCQLWIDFSDANTLFTDAGTTKVTADNDLIYQANDKSGNGYHARNAALSRPLYKTGIQNGLSAALGDGSRFLLLISGLDMAKNVSTLTLFAVYKTATVAAGRRFIFTIATASGAARAVLTLNNTAGKSEVGGRRLDTDSFVSIDGGNINTTNFFALCGAFDYANSNLYAYDNGSLSNSNLNFQTDGNTSNADSSKIEIGNGAASLNGYWAELLVYNSLLSNIDRQKVDAYLNEKWALY